MVGTILTMLGYELSESTLAEIIAEVDEDGEEMSAIVKILDKTELRRLLVNVENVLNVRQVLVNWNLKNSAHWQLDSWLKKIQKQCSRN